MPCIISKWKELDLNKHSCFCNNKFRKALLSFIRPGKNKIYNINSQVCIKLSTRLRQMFNYLHEQKFRHKFEDTLNLLCSCSTEAETTLHFYLRCHFFNDIRKIVLNDFMNIDKALPSLIQGKLISVFLYRSDTFDNKTNSKILICTLQFIKQSGRFDVFFF